MTLDDYQKTQSTGMIAWMTRNSVTPNLMMIIFIVGGFLFARTIKQEVFPEFDLDMVTITVPYPGSSPAEVEQGIILVIEEAVRGLDGIKEIRASANEGVGIVTVELLEGIDKQKVYQDIKQQVDRIVTFPQDVERPEVSMVMRRIQVMDIQLYGDTSEWVLRELAEQVRDSLLQNADITQVELQGARSYEIHVQIDQETLRRYNLTLQGVAGTIRSSAIELPGGYIEARSGDILLRVMERRDWAKEFARMPIITTASGGTVYLSDIAHVTEGFQDTDQVAYYNGKRAIGINIFRVGRQTPIGVSDAARKAMAKIEEQLPPGVGWTVGRDMSDIYRQRLELMLSNAFLGLILVLGLLGLFLEFKLAVWVTMGIPTSFLGAFLFLSGMGVTINMISMFAFIIALGIVVDDAIVVGENIYEYRNRGMGLMEAAIQGARDVALPVTFSILTNMVAFLPLCFVPGLMGKFFIVIPLVVITVFAISWIEALFILPAHLSHVRKNRRNPVAQYLHSKQQAFSQRFMRFVETRFGPFLDTCIRYRQLSVAVGFALLIVIVSFVASGRIGIVMMPRVESDVAIVTAILPYGSPMHRAESVSDTLVTRAREVVDAHGGDALCKGIFTNINEQKVEVSIYLTDPEVRPLGTMKVINLWRDRVGQIEGLESLRFEADRGGPGSGANLTIELTHRDIAVLDRASERLAAALSDFPNVKDIDDGYTPGKQQLNFTMKPKGLSLGLTAWDVARQIRSSFYGAEALRQQRGRNEVRVFVKLPDTQRDSEYNIEQLLIWTSKGRTVPLMEVASVTRGRAYTTISRRNGQRTVTVTGNVEPASETNQILDRLKQDVLPELRETYPSLGYDWEGQQADMRESMGGLMNGFGIAMFAIYAMLAIPFRSYIQPVIVMVAIPFGIVGAVLGHVLMGYSLSLMSMMGIVALSGVVVNDSLVLIDYANRLHRNEGYTPFDAIHQAGIRRFRPIILTTFTTFGGLTPIIFETSMQARFLIPMAISLGFGIMFATSITLILVPCLYLMIDDAVRLKNRFMVSLNGPQALETGLASEGIE
ncbi:MAG: efflux RND transporter permease subunit [Phycisphaerae bacterium]|nr:efflux RND transporter permease subunit [Phycisphaerae bacterium]